MSLFFSKPKDERVQTEINKIYRIGFFVLTFGILFDVILQCASLSSSPRPVELISLISANILCVILMLRKGFGDDSQYAETDRFPRMYYLIESILAGLAAGAVNGLLIGLRMDNTADFVMVLAVSTLSVFLLTAPLVYFVQYLCFRTAKKRRKNIEKQLDEDE